MAASSGATPAYRVKVDGRDVRLYTEKVSFGSGGDSGENSFAGPYFFGSFEMTNAVDGAKRVRPDCHSKETWRQQTE